MSLIDKLEFGFRKKLPIVLQTEATECGLACIAMISSFHGKHTDIASMRLGNTVSLKGTSLATIIQIAKSAGLASRAIRLEVDSLSKVNLPAILHWNFNHFVVLESLSRKHAIIHDPAVGVRRISYNELSAAFTGVALELWPGSDFVSRKAPSRVPLSALLGRVSGLGRALAQILVLALVLEVFSITSPLLMQWVIDDVLVSGDKELLTTLILAFGALLVFQQVFTALRAWVILYLGTTLNVQWRTNVFSHLLTLPVQFFEKRHLGDVVSRFGAVDLIQKTLTASFLEAILDGIMTCTTLVMMFLYSPSLTWVTIGAMVLYILGRWFWYRPLRNATEEQIIYSAKQSSHFLETVRGIKAIKLFQRQDERCSTWLAILVDQINADLRAQKLFLWCKTLNGVLFGTANVLVVWLGAKDVIAGQISVGTLVAFNSYRFMFDSRVSSLVDRFYELKMLQLQGDRLSDIVLAAPELIDHRAQRHHSEEASLEVKNLHFRYADHEPHVLKGVAFKVNAGESVAIVGPSGCGKTTLMNIMLGILSPNEGAVYLGGVDVQLLGLSNLRNIIGTVLQDDVLFAGSIAQNITFFDAEPDADWMTECARMAAIASEVEAMQMGYNTLVGDMGTVLSGGQKQRILLARALYKRPRILFLDEATSHLDLAKEKEVNDAIRSLTMTRVVIAHRPETIASADRVIDLTLHPAAPHQNSIEAVAA